MSTGFGFQGAGRCYPIWRDFALCKNGSANPGECTPFFQDYITCTYGWADPENVELFKRQVALSEEQEKWQKQYGKKMAAHVRTFETEAAYEEWKESLGAKVVETPATMDELNTFTKEKLNPQ